MVESGLLRGHTGEAELRLRLKEPDCRVAVKEWRKLDGDACQRRWLGLSQGLWVTVGHGGAKRLGETGARL